MMTQSKTTSSRFTSAVVSYQRLTLAIYRSARRITYKAFGLDGGIAYRSVLCIVGRGASRLDVEPFGA